MAHTDSRKTKATPRGAKRGAVQRREPQTAAPGSGPWRCSSKHVRSVDQ